MKKSLEVWYVVEKIFIMGKSLAGTANEDDMNSRLALVLDWNSN